MSQRVEGSEYRPIELGRSLHFCMEFRREAHLLSYGNLETYDEGEVVDWFRRNSEQNSQGFKHIYVAGELAGQLEFRAPITELGIRFGYIYLIYLKEAFRGKSIASAAQKHMFDVFISAGCREARLRCIPGNQIAEAFYRKHGWVESGVACSRGQLLVRQLM